MDVTSIIAIMISGASFLFALVMGLIAFSKNNKKEDNETLEQRIKTELSLKAAWKSIDTHTTSLKELAEALEKVTATTTVLFEQRDKMIAVETAKGYAVTVLLRDRLSNGGGSEIQEALERYEAAKENALKQK